jgi:hypothetical protein
MKCKPFRKMPRLFERGQDLRVFLDTVSIPDGMFNGVFDSLNLCLRNLRSLGIFGKIEIAAQSTDCDIFVTISQIVSDDKFDGSIVGATTFPRHPSGKRYAEVRLDPRISWEFVKPKWYQLIKIFLDKSELFARWLMHELLHAIGLSHTTEKVSRMPSIMDEDNWSDKSTDMKDWDVSLARRIYGIEDENSNQL